MTTTSGCSVYNQIKRLVHATCFATHLQIRMVVDQQSEAAPDDRMIINDDQLMCHVLGPSFLSRSGECVRSDT